MALHHVLSVKDLAAQAFGRPLFVPATGVGVRSFGDEVNRQSPDNQMNTHPADFELYTLGVFDDADGSFSAHAPQLLARGVDVAVKPA